MGKFLNRREDGPEVSLDELLDAGHEWWTIIDTVTEQEVGGPYLTREEAEEAAERLWEPGSVKVWPIAL